LLPFFIDDEILIILRAYCFSHYCQIAIDIFAELTLLSLFSIPAEATLMAIDVFAAAAITPAPPVTPIIAAIAATYEAPAIFASAIITTLFDADSRHAIIDIERHYISRFHFSLMSCHY
jgi:hypothetical protein